MESLEEKQLISTLLDIYGGLLTGRQRDFLDLYYNEDLSYGEIADSENISRQAVHDTIHHGKKALLRFEEHLGLVSNPKSEQPVENSNPSFAYNLSGKDDSSIQRNIDFEKLRKEMMELSRLASVDITYDMIPIQRQVKRLRELLGLEGGV